jgi:hypothetical protein
MSDYFYSMDDADRFHEERIQEISWSRRRRSVVSFIKGRVPGLPNEVWHVQVMDDGKPVILVAGLSRQPESSEEVWLCVDDDMIKPADKVGPMIRCVAPEHKLFDGEKSLHFCENPDEKHRARNPYVSTFFPYPDNNGPLVTCIVARGGNTPTKEDPFWVCQFVGTTCVISRGYLGKRAVVMVKLVRKDEAAKAAFLEKKRLAEVRRQKDEVERLEREKRSSEEFQRWLESSKQRRTQREVSWQQAKRPGGGCRPTHR